MTKKRVLNIASTKKQDNMVCTTNITPGSATGGVTYTNQPAILSGGFTYIMPWLATARNAQIDGRPGYPIEKATRTSDVCYMRGLKERIQLQSNNGTAWQWRRICFTLRGEIMGRSETTNFQWWRADDTYGVTRSIQNSVGISGGANVIVDYVFKGRQSIDWSSYFTAKLDTERIRVMHDSMRVMQSGNDHGFMRNFQLWHPMNKNLHYQSDEDGNNQSSSPFSVETKLGLGDYYVLDIISAGTGATSSDRMSFDPEATLYWHEK